MTAPPEPTPVRRLARRVFLAFLLTFVAARVLVILIMTRRMPNMFFHAGSTHVHHLHYGIFILSAIGALLVFVTEPSDKLRKLCALLYGFGMALNDLMDIRRDRVFARWRPIPSGRIRPRTAIVVTLVLLMISLAAATILGGIEAVEKTLDISGSPASTC